MTTAVHIPAAVDGIKPGVYFRTDSDMRQFVDKFEQGNPVNFYTITNREAPYSAGGVQFYVASEDKWPTILDMATPGTEAHARATQAAADKEAAEDAAMERLAALRKEFEYLSDPVTNFYTSDRDRALHEAYPDESYGLQRAFGISITATNRTEPAPEVAEPTEADLVMIDAAEAKRARRAAKKMKGKSA